MFDGPEGAVLKLYDLKGNQTSEIFFDLNYENIVILEELCSIKPDYHYCRRIKGANQ